VSHEQAITALQSLVSILMLAGLLWLVFEDKE
jgi:hypothetical protein